MKPPFVMYLISKFYCTTFNKKVKYLLAGLYAEFGLLRLI